MQSKALVEVVELIQGLSPMCQHYKATMNKLNEWLHKYEHTIAEAKQQLGTEGEADGSPDPT